MIFFLVCLGSYVDGAVERKRLINRQLARGLAVEESQTFLYILRCTTINAFL